MARIEAEQGRRSLHGFLKMAWPQLEPETPFVDNWHIGLICELLTAVSLGQVRDLLITVPPRCTKSMTVAVLWPCWEWTRTPGRKWLFASYAESLSVRDNIRARRVLESPWYQERWPLALAGDQNTKTRVDNRRGGYRIATSVEGTATGEGGDIIVADDPHNMKEILSDAKRSAVLFWWDEVMATRLNDPKTGARVIIMQRGHEQDLAGHVLDKGGYTHLMLPMRFEPARRSLTACGADPRTCDGELLWPERFGEREVAQLEKDMGIYAAAGQLQQRPQPRSGGMFPRDKARIEELAPAGLHPIAFWDLAASVPKAGTDPDWTVRVKGAMQDGVCYVLHVLRVRLGASECEALMKQTALADGRDVVIYEEQEPGSSGKNLISHHQRNVFAGFGFYGVTSTGDKVLRAEPAASAWAAGNVRLVRGDWIEAFLDELALFPGGKHDDQVDAFAGVFNQLYRHETEAKSVPLTPGSPEWAKREEDEMEQRAMREVEAAEGRKGAAWWEK